MISCCNLTMRYGDFCALDKLNLQVPAGEVYAVIGPNGAGKSTMLELLAGLQKPTSGSITVLGSSPREVRQEIGMMPENLGLFEDLTVEEHLLLTADVYQAPKSRISQLLRALNLDDRRTTFAAQCSHGMRKKTSFAMALLPNPRVLLLDEPFEAVDPLSTRTMLNVLREAAHERGLTVLLTSHIFSVVEHLADRFALICAGKLVYSGPANLHVGSIEQLYFELVESPSLEKLDWLGSSQF